MTHERNLDGLKQNAQKKRLQAIERTEAGIRQLIKEDRPVNFKTVAETAGVSTAWLYRESDIKARIEQLRSQTTSKYQVPVATRASDASKTAVNQTLKERIRRLEAENRGLREHIEVLQGQVLELSAFRREIAQLKAVNEKLRLERDAQPSLTAIRSEPSKIVHLNSATTRQASLTEDVRSQFDQLGVVLNSTLIKKIRSTTEDVLQDAIAALRERHAAGKVENPAGYLVDAIRQGWKPNQKGSEKAERDAFKQWFDLAYSLNIVKASEKKSDGVQYVYTIDGDWVLFSEIIAEYPLESLREMV